jgi:hypothetical protein
MIWKVSSYLCVFISPSSLSTQISCAIAQAGLFSAALTSFLADSTNSLQVDPAQQMVYYQQQSIALLAQISKQVSSIAPQVSIPSTLPPPYPTFSPNPSDVRVNVFWFMSLVFSLFAALLATLVQQWVRDYMHVFQRYSNPLKSARLRQYLFEGAEGWYMPMVAESVPGLVHVSLFLFFIGLGDSLLSLNTTVGVSTIVPITICGLLYVLSMFAPIINPQSPFQNPFSGVIWYLKQKVYPRRYLDRASGGSLKAVSSNLSQAQMQMAMEENDERKDRDIRAIRWLIHNRTEDDEMESFAMAIPGSFTSKWGIDVWRKVSEVKPYGDTTFRLDGPTLTMRNGADLPISVLPHLRSPLLRRNCHPLGLLQPLGRMFGIRIANIIPHDATLTQPMPPLCLDGHAPDDLYARQDLVIYDLCKRIRHLVGTCDNHSIFTNKELWFKRARGCAETAASLVFCADVKLELFGDLESLLCSINPFLVISGHQIDAPGSDGLFLGRFDCLCLAVAHRAMANNDEIPGDARLAIDGLSQFRMDNDGEEANSDNVDENALRNARRIDNHFETATQFCLYGLREALGPSEVGPRMTEERAREVLERDHEANLSMLERIALAGDQVANVDRLIYRVNAHISGLASGSIETVRGIHFEDLDDSELVQPALFFNPTERPSFLPQFVFLHQRLRLLCSYSSKLRDIINGRGNDAFQEILESLGTLWGETNKPTYKWSGVRHRHLMERQLWRLQDLRDGGGFGFWIETLFLATRQLLYIPLSPLTHSSLILGLFGVVTSNWRQHKHSIGTLRVILNLVCDMAILDRGLISDYPFPTYLTDELLVLFENMLEGQSGLHIDEAFRELEDAIKKQDDDPSSSREIRLFRAKVVTVLSRSRATVPSS